MEKTKCIFFIALISILSGCTRISDFGDTNVDPSTTKDPIPSALLTRSLSFIPDVNTILSCGLYCQYFSETEYPGFSLYSSNMYSPMGYYSTVLFDLQNIINVNSDTLTKTDASHYGTNENQIAIARILKADIFWNITNQWGDIPYKDALKGNPDVDYDTQESIYMDLLKELTEAVAQFKTGEIIAVQGDIVYNGDISKWKKLANSLRMLISLNLSEQYPDPSGYAATEFRAALDDPAGSVSDNSDNFKLDYPGGSAYRNPFYNLYNGSKYYGESATLTSILIDSIGNDERQSVFGADITGAYSELGVPYGRSREFTDKWCQNNPTWCFIFSPSYRTETSPLYLITASHVLLARAEAADRGWTNENVQALYKSGIDASFTQWGLAEPEADYFLNGAVALGPSGTNLKQIALQQYLAYYPDGLQGWNTWRRTGWPELTPAPDAVNFPAVIPRRFMYGTDDYALTARGVANAVARLEPNGDKMDSRVWWDKE
jgi:hypothetical protein